MLLSRVAASVYWAGRYLERAEGTARMIRMHTDLILDLPKAAGVGFGPLLAITGSEESFTSHHDEATEEEIIRFLAADPENGSSIISSLAMARSNFRITRSVFPGSSWEELNQLYLWAAECRMDAVDRRTRAAWLDRVVRQCQLIRGLLAGIMSHDEAYSFLEIGRYIERADMTTRVLDVQAGVLLDQPGEGFAPYGDITWMSVLRSLSAYQMFRRNGVGRSAEGGVSGLDALRFLLKDPQFPRSVEHCLTQISRALLELPRYDLPMAGCADIQARLEDIDELAFGPSTLPGLHQFMDELQIGIAHMHDQVTETYFRKATATDAPLLASA